MQVSEQLWYVERSNAAKADKNILVDYDIREFVD